MNTENMPVPSSVENAITARLAQIQERATHLRLKAESDLARLKKMPALEQGEQQKVEQLADRLIQIFALLRTTQVEQGRMTPEGNYDFEGERFAWEQMVKAFKLRHSETFFNQAYALASTKIEEIDRS